MLNSATGDAIAIRRVTVDGDRAAQLAGPISIRTGAQLGTEWNPSGGAVDATLRATNSAEVVFLLVRPAGSQ